MIDLFQRIIGGLEYRWCSPKLNILKTVYFNFRTMPFSEAIKFPVYIYGGVKLYNLSGSIEFKDTPIKKGLIKFGKNNGAESAAAGGAITLGKGSKIIFEGPCFFGKGFIIHLSSDTVLQMGKEVRIGMNIKIICQKGLSIGDYTRMANDVQFMDNNGHYVLNLETKKVYRNKEAISIGRCNWIANRVSVAKGTRTPDWTIAASNSILNKDYTGGEQNIMIAGVPAKVIAQNVQRIFSLKTEAEINRYFDDNPDSDVFEWDEQRENVLSDLGFNNNTMLKRLIAKLK